MHRSLISFALLLLAGLTACQQKDSGPALAVGTWTLDREASAEATLPLWKKESSARMEAEMDSFVKPPSPGMDKARRGATRELQLSFPESIAEELRLVEVELTVFDTRRFELKSEVPGFEGSQSSGTSVVAEQGDVFLALLERDGVKLEQEQRVKLNCKFDSQGRLTIRWNDYLITVLNPPDSAR